MYRHKWKSHGQMPLKCVSVHLPSPIISVTVHIRVWQVFDSQRTPPPSPSKTFNEPSLSLEPFNSVCVFGGWTYRAEAFVFPPPTPKANLRLAWQFSRPLLIWRSKRSYTVKVDPVQEALSMLDGSRRSSFFCCLFHLAFVLHIS